MGDGGPGRQVTRPAVAAMDAAVPPPPARRFARWLPWAVVAVLVTLLLALRILYCDVAWFPSLWLFPHGPGA